MKHTTQSLKQSLYEVFDPKSIHYIRQELWLWFRHAADEEVLLFEGNPASALFLEKMFRRMIRYAWHLTAREPVTHAPTSYVMSEDRINQERQQMKDHHDLMNKYHGNIRRLRKQETDRPILFFHRFFYHYHTKKKWYKLLHRWSEYSLSSFGLEEMGLLDLKAYELLEGLLESMYLLHLQDHPNPQYLDPVVKLIIETISPLIIFEVRHPSLGNQNTSITELLIVVPDSCQKRISELEPILDLITVTDRHLSCSLHTYGHVIDKLRAGHIYFSLVCIPQNLIYTNGMLDLPDKPELLGTVIADARKTFETGHQKAKSFYDSAARQKHRPLAAFMLQQAAELIFRTVTLALYGCEKKTHHFKVLKQMTRRVAPALSEVLPANTTEEQRLLQLLEDAYIHGRYANDFEVSEEDFQTLYQRVGKLLALSQKIFNERITLTSSDDKHLAETPNGGFSYS